MDRKTNIDPRVERTRASVLEAAHALLLEGGPAAVTYSALAGRAGVGRATLYRHWPRLDQLFAELIADVGDRFEIGMVGDLATDLRAALASMSAMFASPEEKARIHAMIERSLRDDEARRLIEVLESLTPARRALNLAVADGQLPADLDLDVATSLVFGPIMHRAFMTSHPVDDAFIDAVVDAFLASLG